jgi:hypothetical protein
VGRNVTVNLLNGGYISGGYAHSGLDEKFIINPGDVCFVKPVNINKKKHRDRQCVVTGKSRNNLIHVKFTDSDGYGYVEVSDLVPEKSGE